jgi:hypothetical protein
MLPTCRASSRTERVLRSAHCACRAALLLSALAGCTTQNGVVGAEPRSLDAGSEAATNATPTYRSDFDENGGDWQPATPVPGGSTDFGVPISGANDPSTAELLYPGGVDPAGSANNGADFDTEIASKQRFSFGTFRTRLAFGKCDPSEDVVNAAIGYYSDGTSDINQNGISDDLEINFQVLCGTPNYLFLTVFTDYQASGSGGEQFRKLSRVIDFSNGNVFDTPSAEKEGFSMTDTEAAFVQPALFTPGAFYEVGFEWHASSLRFFMQLNGQEQTLWTLSDPAHIPQQPVKFVYNLRHPDSHWYPATGSAAFPANDVLMHVDWFEYYAE